MEGSTVTCTFKFLLKFWDASIHALLEVGQSLCNGTVQGNHRTGAVGLRTYGTELETVSCEGERRGTVTVCVVDEQLRNLRDIHLQTLLASHSENIILVGLLDMVEQLTHLLAKE